MRREDSNPTNKWHRKSFRSPYKNQPRHKVLKQKTCLKWKFIALINFKKLLYIDIAQSTGAGEYPPNECPGYDTK